jgi:hypothetical protein
MKCVRKQMRRATLLKNSTNKGDGVEIKYTKNAFLHIKASESTDWITCLDSRPVCQLIEVERGRGELVWEYLFVCDTGGTVVLWAHSGHILVLIVSLQNQSFFRIVKNKDDIKHTSLPCSLGPGQHCCCARHVTMCSAT